MSEVHGDSELVPPGPDIDYPLALTPRQVILRDRVTVATLVPFASAEDVPRALMKYLSDQFNKEIEKGDTYAMSEPIPLAQFGRYWFSNFGVVMLLGDIESAEQTHSMDRAGANWTKACLGGFHIRPNYPGRSSHVCNGTFIVTDAARNKGVGRLMGEAYLEWAPRLGYTYAVFNLVYESNVASCRLWDSLGFKRIGRVPGGGQIKSQPGEFVDAIIYGRGLSLDGEDSVSQDRFEKIRYYLKHAKYPRGADRAEKSRLRSAATHYKLLGGEDGGGATGRVDGVRDAHDHRRTGATQRRRQPADTQEMGRVEKELGDCDTGDGGQGVAEDGIAWLGERGGDGVVVEDGARALHVAPSG
ncbi:Protein spt10 [Elasticomyces elasticus]|nr:Protein spt10 [Elasticomyces elasticus]